MEGIPTESFNKRIFLPFGKFRDQPVIQYFQQTEHILSALSTGTCFVHCKHPKAFWFTWSQPSS